MTQDNKSCTCASFFTVRRVHKKDCPCYEDNKSWEDDVRQICTYYSEFGEGTAGYDLTEKQFQKLFSFIHSTLNKEREELIKMIEGMETSKEKENVYGGESIEGKNRRIGYNQAIYDILTILKEDGKN